MLLGLLAISMNNILPLARADEEDASNSKKSDAAAIKDFGQTEELLNSPTPKVTISSIEPEQGPRSGDTRVLVRGGPFTKWEFQYSHPVCKFGDIVVEATYVTCAQERVKFDQKEARHNDRVSNSSTLPLIQIMTS